MAKLSSLFKFEGTVADVTVLKNSGVIRRKGGLSRERVATDPNLGRVRENNMEFGMLAGASKLFRETFSDLKQGIRVQNLSSRLSTVFARIKNLDSTSARGYREVSKGLQSAEAKNLLDGFSFNAGKSIKSIMQKTFLLDKVTGTVTINGLTPKFDTLGGVGATRVGFKSYWAKIDFSTGKFVTVQSNQVMLELDNTVSNVELTPVNVPEGTGISVFVLSIVFYQTVNGVDYLLQNGAHNAADIIAVD